MVEQQTKNHRPILGRVVVRLNHCNPRRFIIRDPVKFETWRMLSRQPRMLWNKTDHTGIRVDKYIEDEQ